ncbi:DNA-binding transcriptional regulator, AcrR family [Parafrankia irregularis]|uniref:DNA-binding transcriptional regulator, AcrR family n=1 Tax=Parafrankia irregularis TaxID=795642 RepID=A0A0S4QID5_9ACTN|nr:MULTISPECIES: TetR/AcrR family transcriptional regulator [Parafrankia]MBE3200748.1 TetR/AcrR family transcriptional regulator [Parafrankia sp. CH37]CUU54866.1 DNA-binding transcriptional regulator, AcrR family [Parafrankia irregularis]
MTTASPRELRQREQAERVRERVIDAAEELFGRHGFRETSLRQVAERCEMSVGALYLHLPNKDELLRAVIDRRGGALLGRIRSFAEADGAGIDLLVGLVRSEIMFYRAYPDFGRLMSRLYSSGLAVSPQLSEDIANGYTDAMRLEAEVIRRGQRDGTICGGDADSLARLLASMVGAYRNAEATRPDGTAGIAEEQFVEMVRRAFATPAAAG